MAGAIDSARFFVEQSLPELRDWERKGLFSTDEVAAIAKKRSEFEHKVNGPGTKPRDFARYAEFEMNLEFLRQKRIQRNGIRKQTHGWQRRTMGVMGRATRKFPSDMSLWMQYAELARKQKAFKQLSKVLTSMVRLHPTMPEAWIYAATYAMGELGDMAKARSYMQRGLRFCKESQILWLEFAKLEMSYLAKIYARRGILGLDSVPNPIEHTSLDDEDPDADIIALPTVTAGEIAQLSGAEPTDDNEVLKDPSGTPALSGAIPMAIFEAAMDHFKSEQLGEQFFDMVASFPSLPCTNTVLHHIVAHLNSMNPTSAVALNASIRRSLVGVDISMPSFPQTLASALQALGQTLEEHPSLGLTVKSLGWIAAYLIEDIDSDIRQVLSTTSERLLRRCVGAEPRSVQAKEVVPLLEKIRDSGHTDTAADLAQKALEAWPADPRLLRLVENDAES